MSATYQVTDPINVTNVVFIHWKRPLQCYLFEHYLQVVVLSFLLSFQVQTGQSA